MATESSQEALSTQVFASGQEAPACSCHLLLHQNLLWHHRLGHPSLPLLRGMHSRLLVSGLPRSLPPLPPSPAPHCLPCVEGRQRAAPHSSFPPTIAPLQTLHMDVWGPAPVSGQGRERYFLLVVDDYTRYTTVFPLRRKGEVPDVVIPWIHAFSDLLWDFCRGEGITQSFTLPASPQQNGIAEHRIGLDMEVARTSMIHAATPSFLWPFAVWYAAHQLKLWPRVSLPETSPTLRWTGQVGDASLFRVWGSRAFVCDTSADKLSTCAIPCVFLGFVPDVPGWQIYHPTSRCVFPSHDVNFDESVPFYRLFPYRSAPPPPLPHFLAPGPPPVDPLPPQGLAPSGVSQVDPLPGPAPVEVAVGSGAARGAASGGAASRGAEPGGAEPVGAELEGVEPEGAKSEGSESGGAELQRVLGFPSSTSLTPPLLCPPPDKSQLPLPPASPLPAPSPYTERYGGLTECLEPVSHLVLPFRIARRSPRSRPPPVPGTHAMALRPSSVPLRVPLPAPPESSLPEVPDPESDRAHTTSSTVSRLLATSLTDPSYESAAMSALVADLLDFATACCLDYATALVAESVRASPLSFRGECALGTDVLEDTLEDFECLAAAVPHFASMLLAHEGDPDAPDTPTPRSYAEAIEGPYSSQWQAAMDAEMASWKSTGTYFDEVPPQHEEIWLRCPPGFTGWFLAGTQWSLRRLVYGLRQAPREWHDALGTTLAALGFAPSTADPSLFLRTDTLLPPFFVLVYVVDLVFATADTEALALAKSELQKRNTCTDLGELRSYLGLQITRDRVRRTITLTPSHMVHEVLQRFGFQFSSPEPTPLSTSHSLSAPPADESVELSGPYPKLVGCLMYLMMCTRLYLAYPLSLLAR
ncbi:unnamed protein product [Closterium sp. NIES-54]